MKLKLAMLAAIPLIALGSMSFTGGAQPNKTDTYNTATCTVDTGNGTFQIGSQCYYPDINGPCSRQTACHLNP